MGDAKSRWEDANSRWGTRSPYNLSTGVRAKIAIFLYLRNVTATFGLRIFYPILRLGLTMNQDLYQWFQTIQNTCSIC